jgi:hypothetical protein
MDQQVEDLLAMAMKLTAEGRRLLAQLLIESAGSRETSSEPDSNQRTPRLEGASGMTSVTVILPDDLATQAQAAGLLGERRLAVAAWPLSIVL